ncbi:DUF4442 domain-containing protein [Wielerella bovis]|uniref:DUF4442 domain-containing protein n=1 Tax=Wielerella bovis TaxID=2917790 RepID=UPI00201A1A23|nr:DUF4442 domain-containing protein [Wielerella bovis]ULJ61125.1 DUF4442 domain-containing protein [Wielerella bovis]
MFSWLRCSRTPAQIMKRRLNLWLPLLFSGIVITEIADDFTAVKGKMKNWRLTKNMHGSQFGGSLFKFTDPIYAMMLQNILGKSYYVWDKEAHIDFVKAAYGEVFLECRLSHAEIDAIKNAAANGEKHLPEFTVRLFDAHNETIAIAKRIVYVRLKREHRP